MNHKEFKYFLEHGSSMITDNVITDLYSDIEKIVKAAHLTEIVQKAAVYKSVGVIAINLCETSDLDRIRSMTVNLIQKVVKPIRIAIDTYNSVMMIAFSVKQAWDSIPTIDEYSDLLWESIKGKILALIKNELLSMLESMVCGTRFQRVSISQIAQSLSLPAIQAVILTGVKTVWLQCEKS